jgi:DNA-binding MarR family transcriptional regulator
MTKSTSQRKGFSAAKEGWLKLVASYPNLSGADYAVAIALSTYVNSTTRDAWPSMQRLAADTNRARATVWRSVKRLEALKLLDVTHGRSNRKSNRYRLRLGDMNAEPEKLRRKTTPRGAMLRTRNADAAKPQHTSCEPAARTSEEPEMNTDKGTSEGKRFSLPF